ncbi:MAG TPA: hypothetical protein VFR86_22635 [Burkholderiaceae bacterium]|nr:hypothetical protein [Burkholderiaceae bacterium]
MAAPTMTASSTAAFSRPSAPDQATIPARLGLRVGDWVVVRSKEEILATLDDNACLEALPFQPEMLAFCGRRMRVAKVAHKTCDNIKKEGSRGRRMENAVHLEGGRCDGSAHGGCQADCVFFWKESWLRRENDPPARASATRCTEARVHERARAKGGAPADDPTWVCQTTRLYWATTPLRSSDPRQYIRDITTGNHSAWGIFRILTLAVYRKLVNYGVGSHYLIALFNAFQRITGGKPYPLGSGVIPEGQPTPTATLDLQPGEWVQVKSQEEILATITRSGFNRGMRYDLEMSKYCGERYRVQMRVNRLINEQTGRMITIKNPCIQLENVYCRAQCTNGRLGCPRASNTYWREIWLRRVEPNEAPPSNR